MTPTPDTNNGRVTERIMSIFWMAQPGKEEVKLNPEQYNRVWSHVLSILDEEYEEPQQ